MASINVSCVPRNQELLWLQAPNEHRSYNISHDRAVTEEPRCRRGDGGVTRQMKDAVPEEVLYHIQTAGFGDLFHSYVCQLDHSLLIALTERWRPETNTFHLPVGEATVTLQDVQVIWGLPIHGPPVCGQSVSETRNVEYWKNLCEEYLGIYPEDDDLRKGRMKFNRLASTMTFEHWNPNDEVRCQQMARRYILALIGSALFPDSNSYDVSLNYLTLLGDLSVAGRRSWGSATLCCLYRNLSKGTWPTRQGIDGPLLLLLQYWAWERFPLIAPRVTPFKPEPGEEEEVYNYTTCLANKWCGEHSNRDTPVHCIVSFRSFFNALMPDQIEWTPYTSFINTLPPSCKTGRSVWKYMGPLICWDEVEFHLSDRVARQFGLIQAIPDNDALVAPALYKTLIKSRKSRADFCQVNADYIDQWNNRRQRIHNGAQGTTCAPGYMQWYLEHTVLTVGKPGQQQPPGQYPQWGVNQLLYQDSLVQVDERARQQQEANPQISHLFGDFRTITRETFSLTQQEERMNYSSQNWQFPESQPFQMPSSQSYQAPSGSGAGPSTWAGGPSSFHNQTVFRPSPNSGFQSYQPGNPQAGASTSATHQMFPGNFFPGSFQNPNYYTPNAGATNLFDMPPHLFNPDLYYGTAPPARNISPYPMQDFSPYIGSSQQQVTNLANDEGDEGEEEDDVFEPRRSNRERGDPPRCGTGGHRGHR